MLIRRLVVASLIAGAASAQAGNIPTSAAQPSSVVSGWTTGNGTDVLGSGVLQGNLNLVAGVAHTANGSLADILYGKVAGSVQQVDGQTKLFFQRGIEANYLLASGHGILAATAGLGKSVVGSADGAIISDGLTKAPAMTGGGNNTSTGGTGGGNNTGTGSTGTGSTGTGGTGTGGTGTGSTGTGSTGTGSTSLDTDSGIPVSDTAGGTGDMGQVVDNWGGNSGGIKLVDASQVEAAEVPEPSSIALMLLGMMGAGAIARRRRC